MSHGGIQGGAGLKSDAKLQQKKKMHRISIHLSFIPLVFRYFSVNLAF